MTGGYLFRNGPIHTMRDAGSAPAAALLTRGDAIVHVGAAPDAVPRGVEVVDLAGRALLPGFTDSHLHLVLAAQQRAGVDCRLAADVQDVQRRVRARARQAAPGEWVTGIGWEKKTLFTDTHPSPAPLDAAAPANPVYLMSKDAHSAWLNTLALERLLALPRLPAKSVLHSERGLVLEDVMELERLLVPPPTAEVKRRRLGPFIAELQAHGITSVHSNEPIEDFTLFRDYLRAGGDGKRVRALWNPVFDDSDALRRGYAELTAMAVPGWLGVGGAKLFVDGTLGSLNAAMSVPYVGTADRGMLTMEPQAIAAWLRAIDELGAPCHGVFHAIGDRAVQLVLEQLSRVRSTGPARLHRLEHAQLLPAELAAGALAGLVLSGQPSHMWGDREIVARNLTGALSRRAYAYRTMKDRGGLVVFGSDAPVETIDPWPGIEAAVTRLEGDGVPPWNGGERLSLAEAITAHTADPMRLHGRCFASGTLEPGRLADLVVLSEDPFAVEPTALRRRMRAEMTFVGGELVFET